jgi:hypothetical protein
LRNSLAIILQSICNRFGIHSLCDHEAIVTQLIRYYRATNAYRCAIARCAIAALEVYIFCAITLRTSNYQFAITAQSLGNHCAITRQSLRNRLVITAQSTGNHCAIDW